MKIRFAMPTDKKFVMEFTKHTWDYGDYIKDIWDTWVNDTLGKFFVAEIDKKPVGIMHVTLLTPDFAWMEGARIHPDYRRKGIATELTKACMRWAKKEGAKKIGLLIMETNYPALKAAEKMGFNVCAQWIFEKINLEKFNIKEDRMLSEVKIANTSDFKGVVDFLNTSKGYRKVGRLFAWLYKVLPLDKRFIIQAIEDKRVFLTKDDKSTKITAIGFQEFNIDWKNFSLSIYFGYLDGTAEDMYKIVCKTYNLFKRCGIQTFRLCLPTTEEAKKFLDKLPLSGDLGYVKIYQKKL